MRTKLFLLLLGLIFCDEEKPEIKDYREKITGVYKGIRVDTYWIDTIVGHGVTRMITLSEQVRLLILYLTQHTQTKIFH